MKAFKILINYSNINGKLKSEIIDEVSWSNIEKAEEAVFDIRDHFEHSKFIQKSSHHPKHIVRKKEKRAEACRWYVKDMIDNFDQCKISLRDDKSRPVEVFCFWWGYDNGLVSIELMVTVKSVNGIREA